MEPTPIPALRLRRALQGVRRDHPRPGRNHARQLDCCRLSAVRPETALPAVRVFRGTLSHKFHGGQPRPRTPNVYSGGSQSGHGILPSSQCLLVCGDFRFGTLKAVEVTIEGNENKDHSHWAALQQIPSRAGFVRNIYDRYKTTGDETALKEAELESMPLPSKPKVN